MTRCLLIACSARKRPDRGLLPAVERYDGPWYRVLRGAAGGDLRVWVISAEYGLIPGDTPIPDYDRTMDMRRAQQLLPQIQPALAQALADTPKTFICAGKPYVYALTQCRDAVPAIKTATVAPGGIGTKMMYLKRWLTDGTR